MTERATHKDPVPPAVRAEIRRRHHLWTNVRIAQHRSISINRKGLDNRTFYVNRWRFDDSEPLDPEPAECDLAMRVAERGYLPIGEPPPVPRVDWRSMIYPAATTTAPTVPTKTTAPSPSVATHAPSTSFNDSLNRCMELFTRRRR